MLSVVHTILADVENIVSFMFVPESFWRMDQPNMRITIVTSIVGGKFILRTGLGLEMQKRRRMLEQFVDITIFSKIRKPEGNENGGRYNRYGVIYAS
jgi:hypothetical protein